MTEPVHYSVVIRRQGNYWSCREVVADGVTTCLIDVREFHGFCAFLLHSGLFKSVKGVLIKGCLEVVT